MVATIKSAGLWGVEAHPVSVEVDIQNGLPGFAIVGLPDTAVKESRDRVSAALKNCGFPLPPRRITINLSPADLKKIGPAFDLPIALGLLAVMGKIDFEKMEAFLVFGELSLQGAVAPVQGALALATAGYCPAIRSLLVPQANARELACLPETQVYGVPHLMAVVDHLLGAQTLTTPVLSSISDEKDPVGHLDYAEVRGQAQAKHAMEIAAAGGHNILMIGPPGSGKTMLAQRLPGILPPLSPAEALEATRIHSIGDPQFRRGRLLNLRPFRAPHHSASHTALVGGGSFPKPGEVSLAHHGVLFLDEMPEFPRRTLEVLRQPLEDGFVSIARAAACLRFPARFLLVGALNPCPCGFAFDPQHPCRCSPLQIQRYLMRLSGPLRDRFDLQVTLNAVLWDDLTKPGESRSSASLRERVLAARELQAQRLGPERLNAQMTPQELERYCSMQPGGKKILSQAMRQYHFSARAYHRIVRVARTIADLEQSPLMEEAHVAEAILYRCMGQKFWEGH